MRDQSACCYGWMPAPTEYLVGEAVAPGIAATMDVPVTLRGTVSDRADAEGWHTGAILRVAGRGDSESLRRAARTHGVVASS
jgi:hypothetical protein